MVIYRTLQTTGKIILFQTHTEHLKKLTMDRATKQVSKKKKKTTSFSNQKMLKN